jgi:hypothetical protein
MRTAYNIVWGSIIVVLSVGCNMKHTTSAGDTSLGQVTVTAPSIPSAPGVGKLTIGTVQGLTAGVAFKGDTYPVKEFPSNVGGKISALFAHGSGADQVTAYLTLELLNIPVQFNMTTGDVNETLPGVISINYAGPNAGAGEPGTGKFSCTQWTAFNVAFTQVEAPGLDRLEGDYEATCHSSQDAKDGDRGHFIMTRLGTKIVIVQPPTCPEGKHLVGNTCVDNPPPPPPSCTYTLGVIEVKEQGDWIVATLPLDHNGFPQARIKVTALPQGCAPSVIVGSSDVDWLTIDNNQNLPGYLLFNVKGNSSKTDTRTAHITINGIVVTATQDHDIDKPKK